MPKLKKIAPEVKADVVKEDFSNLSAQPTPSTNVGRRKANVVDHRTATNLRKVKF